MFLSYYQSAALLSRAGSFGNFNHGALAVGLANFLIARIYLCPIRSKAVFRNELSFDLPLTEIKKLDTALALLVYSLLDRSVLVQDDSNACRRKRHGLRCLVRIGCCSRNSGLSRRLSSSRCL